MKDDLQYLSTFVIVFISFCFILVLLLLSYCSQAVMVVAQHHVTSFGGKLQHDAQKTSSRSAIS